MTIVYLLFRVLLELVIYVVIVDFAGSSFAAQSQAIRAKHYGKAAIYGAYAVIGIIAILLRLYIIDARL